MERTIGFSYSLLDIDNSYVFMCPNCDAYVQVNKSDVNCSIFRHGYKYLNTNSGIKLTKQVDPHLPKRDCDELLNTKQVLGCCKPFKINLNCNSVEICGYI